jgi:hypothetical protein
MHPTVLSLSQLSLSLCIHIRSPRERQQQNGLWHGYYVLPYSLERDPIMIVSSPRALLSSTFAPVRYSSSVVLSPRRIEGGKKEKRKEHCDPAHSMDSSNPVPVRAEHEGDSLNNKPDGESIVIKDGKRYKKRAQLPPLAELLKHGDKPSSEKTPKERCMDFLFGPLLLAVAFFLSFLFWSHFIMKGPHIASPGMDLMNRINSMQTMKDQIERAKELHSNNAHSKKQVIEDL